MGTDSTGVSRRSFFGVAAFGVGAAIGAPTLLSACSGSDAGSNAPKVNDKDLSAVLPKYAESTGGPTPELPSVEGAATASTDPGYLKYPTDLVKTATTVPGAGGKYTAITPLWGTIPKANNPYYQAVNKALGAELTVKPADGNNYAQTVPTLVAGDKLPDWIQIPSWWNGNLNVGQLAASKFADLTPYLAGDKASKYPNLAAIPSGGWQAGTWQNKLYGIPSYTSQQNFAAALFYRKDIFDAQGIDPGTVNSADALEALGKQLTSASSNVWAFDGLWLTIQQMFNVPQMGNAVTVVDGKVISAFDTPELEAALAYAYKMAKSGYIHPDSLAGNDANAGQRFWSGKVLVGSGGLGGWNLADSLSGKAADPKYVRGAFPLFSHDGTPPTIALGSSASVISYLNKKLTPEQIQECLAIANYLASPYGSYEYTLINYGIEGRDWTMGDGGPEYTTQGTKESNQTTYQFLASYRNVVINSGQPDITNAVHAWAAGAVKYAYKPPFWNMNVATPSQFASISTGTQVNDIIKEVTFGKKTVAEFKTAAANWKTSGGQRLVDWYQKEVVEKFGTGQ